MRIVGRAIGWITILAGLSVLIADVLAWLDTKNWAPIALVQLWSELDRPSLNVAKTGIERDLSPVLWDPIVINLLRCWAFVALIAAGAVLLLIFAKRARRRR